MPKKNKPVRQASELLGKVMEPVLARRSGMTMELLAAWPELVGEEYGGFTRPERIKWPGRAHADDPFSPGVLVVACDRSRAVFFQHELSRVCQRVNVFFGFAAIERIRIAPKPVNSKQVFRQRAPLKLDDEKKKRLESILRHVKDPELREKLEKLGHGVMSKQD